MFHVMFLLEYVTPDAHKLTDYRIYSCISRPFTTKKSAQKIALDLYTSYTHRPDKAVQEINITIVWSAFTNQF